MRVMTRRGEWGGRQRCYVLGAQSRPDVDTGEQRRGRRVKVAALLGVVLNSWGDQVQERRGLDRRRLQGGQGAGGILGITKEEGRVSARVPPWGAMLLGTTVPREASGFGAASVVYQIPAPASCCSVPWCALCPMQNAWFNG